MSTHGRRVWLLLLLLLLLLRLIRWKRRPLRGGALDKGRIAGRLTAAILLQCATDARSRQAAPRGHLEV